MTVSLLVVSSELGVDFPRAERPTSDSVSPLADGWLGDVGPRRGAGEVPLLGHRHDVPELPQLHKKTLSDSIRAMSWTSH